MRKAIPIIALLALVLAGAWAVWGQQQEPPSKQSGECGGGTTEIFTDGKSEWRCIDGKLHKKWSTYPVQTDNYRDELTRIAALEKRVAELEKSRGSVVEGTPIFYLRVCSTEPLDWCLTHGETRVLPSPEKMADIISGAEAIAETAVVSSNGVSSADVTAPRHADLGPHQEPTENYPGGRCYWRLDTNTQIIFTCPAGERHGRRPYPNMLIGGCKVSEGWYDPIEREAALRVACKGK